MQWQRAHVAVADIKRENHDMVLVFGNEMADVVAKGERSGAARSGSGASILGGCAGMAGPKADHRGKPAGLKNHAISREKGLRRAQCKTVLQSFSEQSAHQLAFQRSRQRSGLQAEHGRNVVSTLA